MDEQNKEQDTGYKTDTTLQEERIEPPSPEGATEQPARDEDSGSTLAEDVPGQTEGQAAPQPQGPLAEPSDRDAGQGTLRTGQQKADDRPEPSWQQGTASDDRQEAPWQQGQAGSGWQNAPAPWQQGQAGGGWQNAPAPGQQGQVGSGWQNAPAPGQQGQVGGGWQNAPAPGQQGQAGGGWQNAPAPGQQGQVGGGWQNAPAPRQQGPYPQGGIYPPPYPQNIPQRELYGQGTPTPGPQRALYDPNGQQRPPMNSMAVTSMVLGIASILLSCCCFPVGFIISFALGMGGLALAIISKKGRPFSGFAIAGLILSILGICGSLFIFGCYILTAHIMQDPEYSALFNEIFQQYYNGN